MHHGWILVGLVFATQFVSSGLGIYAFGVLLGPLAEDLGTTRAGISSVLVAMSVAGAAIGPLVGRAVLRIPIHWIMAVGALVMAFSFLWLSRADSLLQLQLGYGIGVAFGMGTLGGVPGAALIVNWFDERRALAEADARRRERAQARAHMRQEERDVEERAAGARERQERRAAVAKVDAVRHLERACAFDLEAPRADATLRLRIFRAAPPTASGDECHGWHRLFQ